MNHEEQTGVYIFCGIQTEDQKEFGEIEMNGEVRKLYPITYKDAAFIATEVPMKIYHPNKENLMMHQQAISLVMKQSDTAIPVSFGNVFHSKEDVRMLLEKLYPQFQQLFPVIKGKIEVGLKLVGKKAYLDKKVKESTRIGNMAAATKGKSKAAGYYERIELGGAVQKLFANLQHEMKQEIYDPLTELAEAAKANDPISEKMLLNGSFLIERDKEKAFDQKVNELHEKWKDKLEFHYSGPWPAYNFVNIRLKVEEG
ncbi:MULTISPECIES: GvpL/GvpF family gas vesicle protein [Bacillus]|uniref:GvpL/GvpF family gas vesicle protein n=1 Tax=Bacillus TaxID=1386 RepID=UPI000BB91C41|nr:MULTISPECIES: GvpL/GvpF family gas vesicle protein [Bacillus]